MNPEDLSLEAHLRDLLEFRPSTATGSQISAEHVIRRFRRHRTRRTAIGACAATLALGAGTFTVVNQSSATTGPPAALRSVPPTPDELSHVLRVPLEQQFTVTAGFQAWLTGQGLCSETASAFDGLPEATHRPTDCSWFAMPGTTVTLSPQFSDIASAVDGKTHQRWVTLGAYTGSTIPANITVTVYSARTTTASDYETTIVTADSLPGEFGFYVVLPYADVKAIGTPSTTVTATAYDATGQVLATTYHP